MILLPSLWDIYLVIDMSFALFQLIFVCFVAVLMLSLPFLLIWWFFKCKNRS